MPQRPVAFSRCSWRRICPGEMLTPLRVFCMRPGRSCQNKGTLSFSFSVVLTERI